MTMTTSLSLPRDLALRERFRSSKLTKPVSFVVDLYNFWDLAPRMELQLGVVMALVNWEDQPLAAVFSRTLLDLLRLAQISIPHRKEGCCRPS